MNIQPWEKSWKPWEKSWKKDSKAEPEAILVARHVDWHLRGLDNAPQAINLHIGGRNSAGGRAQR